MSRNFCSFKSNIIAIIILTALGSCNYGADNLPERSSKVSLYCTALTNNTDPVNSIRIGDLTISNLQVGTQNIQMNYASSSEFGIGSNINNANIRTNDEAELSLSASQPQINTLISSGNHRTAILGEGSTPNGNYTEIAFQLYPNKNASSDSFVRDKSLYILGSYNGRPIRIWLTSEDTFRVPADTPNGYVINADADLILRFNLVKLLENVNIETARDRNSDGFIDIGPNNVDGNSDIYSVFRSNLPNSVEFAK
ncbi:hypothetical protein [Anditalea andensis]|uniref:Dockerin domain-containing protein n=1 Tax=Anditalea andensis TaxID=1048983 RepID=A0A074LHE0_9BACT|nr:hypothetical protein [Anditalea andensis]KEO73197.1 hypothetical protein EL17_12640 [Anditalea andensis]